MKQRRPTAGLDTELERTAARRDASREIARIKNLALTEAEQRIAALERTADDTILPGQQYVPTNEVSICPPGHAYDPVHGLCVPYFPAINIPGYGQQCPDGYYYDPVHNVCTLFPPVYPTSEQR